MASRDDGFAAYFRRVEYTYWRRDDDAVSRACSPLLTADLSVLATTQAQRMRAAYVP